VKAGVYLDLYAQKAVAVPLEIVPGRALLGRMMAMLANL
jgi:hypothetical protein